MSRLNNVAFRKSLVAFIGRREARVETILKRDTTSSSTSRHALEVSLVAFVTITLQVLKVYRASPWLPSRRRVARVFRFSSTTRSSRPINVYYRYTTPPT
jgi:hypothetical protein